MINNYAKLESSLKKQNIGQFLVIVLFFLLCQTGIAASQQTVTGTVMDESGMPLPGATIQIEGTSRGVNTNMDGGFSIDATPDDVLLISFIGFNTQEVPVSDETNFEITMTENLGELNEVVVVGYGQQQKVDLIAPIQVVDNEKLKKIPTASPAEALQGLVSGVTVSSNGAPGAAPSIQIRGLGSVRGDFSPLYVVDGVVTKDIGFLDMNSVESMSVLKDASSAAIYGVRAANGVIIIETKRGKTGKPTISYEGYAGVQVVTRGDFSLLNNENYIDFTNNKLEANAKRNNSTFFPFDANDYPENTNWFDEILRTAFTQKHSLNISGGSEDNRYFVGLNYLEQEGVVKKNKYERVNVRITDDIDFNDYFRAGISTDMSVTKVEHVAGGLLGQAYRNPPVYSPRDENGDFTNPDNLGLGQYGNPAATLDRWNNTEPFTTRNISNIYFEVIPLEGLTLKTSFSADIRNYSTRNYARAWDVSITQTDDSNALTRQYGRQFNYVWDNTITYKREIEKHRFTILAGSAYTSYFSQFLRGFNTGVEYFSDPSLYLVNGDETTQQQASDGGSKRVNQSFFGRLSYTFDNKYLLNATLRTDGSSSFPEDNRWATFPSIGLGWVASEENFLNELKSLDYLKLRASYGMLGNSDIPQGTYILPVDNRPYLSAVFGPYDSTNITQGATITTSVQPDLSWEIVEEYDFGFDSKWFENRLTLEMDYYYRTTKDAIFPVILSPTAGVSTPSGGNDRAYLDNNASILNKGLELLVGWNKQVNDDFSYNISANATFQENEITELQTGTIALFNGYRSSSISQVGRPVGEFYVYEVDGIFQNKEEINNYVDNNGDLIMPNAVPGDFKYADNNDDGLLDDQDKVSAGNYLPSFMYGINFNMEYKNIDFSIQGQGVEGVSVFNVKRIARSGNQNIDQDFYDNMWQGQGTSNTYPSGDVLGGRNPDPNTFNVESGDYFRVRNITLGYTFNSDSLLSNALSRLRIYASATNPITFHSYNGFTPEIPGGNPTNRGYDNGVYPISATYLIGLNINL